MNIISFDIEEWYNYAQFGGKKGDFVPELYDTLYKLIDTLDTHNVKATCFCLGWLARKYPDVVKLLSEKGHEIGCHSDMHHKLWEFDENRMKEDTRTSIDSIEQLIGKKVTTYRAPAFSLGKNNIHFIEILKEYGIEIDCSIYPGIRDFGGFDGFSSDKPCMLKYKEIEMKELPISLTTICGKKIAYSGGGYFRILPYFLIKHIMMEKNYNMSYLHIHDFNGKQKRMITTRYIKNYYGNRWSLSKLQKFLSDFDFITVSQANEIIDWHNVPSIEF